MHADLTRVDPDALLRAIGRQAPDLALLPLTPCPGGGTENHLFRLGDGFTVRVPMRPESAAALETEGRWLPQIGPALPLETPEVLLSGQPDVGFPLPFLVQTWVSGQDAEQSPPRDLGQAAEALANLIAVFRRLPVPPDAPKGGPRGGLLAPQDTAFQASLVRVRDLGLGDAAAAATLWQSGLAAAPWDGPPVWLHADLMPANLITRDGRLSGLIDFGCLCVGDPAYDLTPLWFLLDPPARARFCALTQPDPAMLARARARVVWQAVMALPYYRDTNPKMMRMATHGLRQALSDDL